MDTKSETNARESVARRWLLGYAIVGVVTLACVCGCASGRALQSELRSPWLDGTGFPERATWPSRLLHLDRRRMPRSARLSSLVDQAPGIVVGQPQGESWGVQRALPDGSRCDVAVHLNGVEIRRKHAGGDWTLDFLVLMRDLDGVEIHVGPELPLMDDSGCGVLLLWSEAAAQGVSASFHGSIEGIYWGTGEVDVVEVALEGSDQRAELTGGGTFVFREVLPGLQEVLIRTARETVGRDTVRVYAYARSAMDIALR